MKKLKILIILLIMLCPGVVKAENIEVTLADCVDGDTAKFTIADGTTRTYRFLAIDTPETVHPTEEVETFGKEASDYTCNALTNAQKIVLEIDEVAGNSDRYDRGLAWVFVDDVLLQQSLVSLGYAEVAYLYDDYKYNDLLKDTQVVAEQNKVGIWSIEKKEEEVTNKEKTQKEKNTKKETSKNFIEKIINAVLEAITASINEMIDSILQKLEDMLS